MTLPTCACAPRGVRAGPGARLGEAARGLVARAEHEAVHQLAVGGLERVEAHRAATVAGAHHVDARIHLGLSVGCRWRPLSTP
jgi:hypothetical protein